MTDFVYDGTSVPDGKSDLVPLNGTPSKHVTAAEWNTVMAAIQDLRDAILTGNYHGLTSDPTVAVSPSLGVRLRNNAGNLEVSANGSSYHTIGSGDPGIFNVLDYGAVADGVTDNLTAFNNATDGMTDSPNVILSDQATLEYYNRTLLSTTRYLDAQSKTGDLSFRALEYQGIKWYWDRQCPSGRLYGLNTNYIHFVTDPAMLFDWSEPLTYPNQMAFTRLCGTRILLRCTSRMFHFVTDCWTA